MLYSISRSRERQGGANQAGETDHKVVPYAESEHGVFLSVGRDRPRAPPPGPVAFRSRIQQVASLPFPKFVKRVRPSLHHLRPRLQVLGIVVCAGHFVLLGVGELQLDMLVIKALLV